MRAVRLHAFGQPLILDDVPEPVPGPDEVLFELAFIDVNPLDVWLTEGTVAGGGQRLPFVPGSSGAGTVEGRRVAVRGAGLGVTRDGVYAERAAVPAEAVVNLPDDVPLEQAAGLGVAGTTAWRLVHDIAETSAEDHVLVLGASGGVGTLAVQLAAAVGATVWGQTTAPEKVGFIREQGAAEVVVAGAGALADAARGFAPTVVLDPLGDGFTLAAVAAMAPHGRLVLFGASAGPIVDGFDLRVMYRKAVSLLSYSGTIEPQSRVVEGLEQALGALVRGEMHVPIDDILPLEGAPEAHERIRHHGVRGKLLLRP
jgi:NADPH2:quinone reductase